MFLQFLPPEYSCKLVPFCCETAFFSFLKDVKYYLECFPIYFKGIWKVMIIILFFFINLVEFDKPVQMNYTVFDGY